MIVCKFGGSSLSCRESIERVAEIVRSNDARRFVVVSAMGRASPKEEKITDLLIKAYNGDEIAREEVRFRHEKLCRELSLPSITDELDRIDEAFKKGCGFDYFVSRGEYLMAKIISGLLGMPFIDGTEIAAFSDEGRWLIKETFVKATENLKKYDCGVIAGFYGEDGFGRVRLFDRGGSDISGAVAAYALDADLYENWTDVDGFLSADPERNDRAEVIRCLSYGELAELSYYGARVLHYLSVVPLTYKLIPLCVRNTFNTEAAGTTVTYRASEGVKGIAVKDGVLYEIQCDAEPVQRLFPDAVRTVNGIRLFSSDPETKAKLIRSGVVLRMKMTEASVIAAASCRYGDFGGICRELASEGIEPLFAEYSGSFVHICVEQVKSGFVSELIYDKLLGEKKRFDVGRYSRCTDRCAEGISVHLSGVSVDRTD